jgi:hypothetical protein
VFVLCFVIFFYIVVAGEHFYFDAGSESSAKQWVNAIVTNVQPSNSSFRFDSFARRREDVRVKWFCQKRNKKNSDHYQKKGMWMERTISRICCWCCARQKRKFSSLIGRCRRKSFWSAKLEILTLVSIDVSSREQRPASRWFQ